MNIQESYEKKKTEYFILITNPEILKSQKITAYMKFREMLVALLSAHLINKIEYENERLYVYNLLMIFIERP